MAHDTKTTAVAAGLRLLCLMSAMSLATAGNVYRLLVLHTNDMHSHFDQIDRLGGPCVGTAAEMGTCFGGFARIKSAVDQMRSSAAIADNSVDGTLFLNAGDTFQGTPFYSFFKWTIVAQMLQMLSIDVMSLGNHEFDDGVGDLVLFLKNITIPVVACNLNLSKEPLLEKVPNLMKSKVLTVNGRQIGIIGYLTPITKEIANTGNVEILPEIPAISAEAKRLKNQGINILIALGHSGFQMDIKIAENVEDIDLVVGGHSNTFLYTGHRPDIETPVGPYPFVVEQTRTKRKVPVVQASHITKYLGELWIEFDEAGEVIKSHGNPILLDSRISQDSELLNEVEKTQRKIMKKTDDVIGSSSVFLEGTNDYCRVRECNFGNFVTDSFVQYNVQKNIKSFDLTKQWTDAPIAIMQGGGFRKDINPTARGGNITYGDIISVMPFRNDLGKITTTGSSIWAAFEHAVHKYNRVTLRGEFLQASGLIVVIDLSQPSGKRVKSIQARCGYCTVPVYEPLDLNANYTIIISHYLSIGGDGINFKQIVKYQSFDILEETVVEMAIRAMSPLRPEINNRITLLNLDKLQAENSGQLVSAPLLSVTLLLAIFVSLL